MSDNNLSVENLAGIPETSSRCRHCGKVFPSSAALAGHAMTHTPAGACPECGRNDFKQANALARHRSVQHGVVPAYKNKAQHSKQGRPATTAPDIGWKVEDIFTAVLGTLYPRGAVPIAAIPALIQWRDDTQRMLEKVMHAD